MLAYMIALPFIVLAYYHCMPTFGEVINLSTISILMIYIPVGISEALSYTPILGSSTYLTFITGNIMNLKLPVAVNAMKPAVKTASNYLIPALFGSLTLGLFSSTKAGKKVVKNGIAGVIPVLVIVAVLALFVRITSGGSLFGAIGFLILFMLPVAIISSRIMWKKGIIKVVDNNETAS